MDCYHDARLVSFEQKHMPGKPSYYYPRCRCRCRRRRPRPTSLCLPGAGMTMTAAGLDIFGPSGLLDPPPSPSETGEMSQFPSLG